MTPDNRLLVVNADDFGFWPSIDRAIVRSARDGIVTSASVIPTGATIDSIATLRDLGVGVGVHLTIVGGGAALLSASEIPSLVDRGGRLPLRWRGLVARSLRGALDPADLEREWAAQIEAVHSRGVAITHLDTHQNVHLWPAVGAVTVGLARRYGIPVVRVPRTAGRSPFAGGVRLLSRRLEQRATRAGLATTGASVGLDEAGGMHGAVLESALERLACSGAAAVDLICHPGEAGDAILEGLGWGFDWAAETEAMCDPATRRAVAEAGFTLGSYAQLASSPVGSAARTSRRSTLP